MRDDAMVLKLRQKGEKTNTWYYVFFRPTKMNKKTTLRQAQRDKAQKLTNRSTIKLSTASSKQHSCTLCRKHKEPFP